MKHLKHKHLTFLSFLLALLLIFSALPLQVMAEDPIQPEIESGDDELIPADPGIPGDPDEPNGPINPFDPDPNPQTITEGVYKIKLLWASYCANIPQSSVAENTQLYTWLDDGYRNSQFKFCYLGNNKYCIRSMLKSDMGLAAYGGTLVNKSIGTSNTASSVPTSAQWYIYESASLGYYFKNVSTGSVMTAGSISNYDYGITLLPYSSIKKTQEWKLVPVTGSTGITMHQKESMLAVGESFTFAASCYSSMIGYNSQTVSWSVTNGTGSATINSAGVLTGVSVGTVTVTASFTYSGNTYSDSCTVHVVPFAEGTYFIQNRHSDLFVQVDDDDAPSYSNNGGIMRERSFDGDNYQKWNLLYADDGYYRIASAVSGYAVTVPSGYETSNNVNLILTQYYGMDYQKWKITLTSHGSYMIQAKSAENHSPTVVWAISPYPWFTDGLEIQQREYWDNSSYHDEWNLFDATPQYIGTFTNWNSDGNSVGLWNLGETNTVQMYTERLGETSNSPYFFDGIINAMTEWSSTLNISFTSVNSPSNSSLNIYCGSFEDIADKYGSSDIDWVGLSVCPVTSSYGMVNVGNEIKYFKNPHSWSNIYIIAQSTSSLQKNVTTHEIGHSLGYSYHSTNSTDIMYKYCHSGYQLSTAEKNHLLQSYQVYELIQGGE